jgi:solute carrier family 9B (sodium/hydrogen exchanger), member 1/2
MADATQPSEPIHEGTHNEPIAHRTQDEVVAAQDDHHNQDPLGHSEAFDREMNEVHLEEGHNESDEHASGVEVELEHETSSDDDQPAEPSVYSGMEVNPSFAALPRHLKTLAKEIRRLDPTDLLTISEMTQRIASRELYSLLPYTGSNWYLPEIRTVLDDEPKWGLGYDSRRGVEVTLAGRCLTFHIGAWLLRAAILVLFWYMLYNVLGSTLMTRGGYVWDPLVTFVVSAIVGGTICRVLQIPPLLGVLWIAIMWHNIGPEVGYLTDGIYKDVSKIAQRVGLTVVLVRAGFSLSFKSIRPHFRESLLLATIPYGVELTVHSLMAKELFSYDSYTWAFLQGCLCSTVSPAIVVPGVLYLQDQGYGKGNGPLSLMMSAVGLEVCFGVWAANFIIGLLFDSTPIAQAIVLGPVQIIGHRISLPR